MSDIEINEAVARKLGCCPGEEGGWVLPDKRWLLEPPDYCHSIAATWDIVDWIGEKCTSVNLTWDEEVGMWEFSLISSGKRFTAIEQTAPMAICQAFLKLSS